MTDLSARFALPMLQPGQAQKELFHNEALARIDAALHPAAASVATNDPPTTPLTGQAWIVGATPTGAWAGKYGALATWTSGGWRFVAPVTGMMVWITDASHWSWYDGVAWRLDLLPVGGIAIGGHRILGPRRPAIADSIGGATVDSEARATIANILSALRTHGLIDA